MGEKTIGMYLDWLDREFPVYRTIEDIRQNFGINKDIINQETRNFCNIIKVMLNGDLLDIDRPNCQYQLDEWKKKGDDWFFSNGIWMIRGVLSVRGYELLNQIRIKQSLEKLNTSIRDFDESSKDSFDEMTKATKNFEKSSQASFSSLNMSIIDFKDSSDKLSSDLGLYTLFLVVLTLIVAIASILQIYDFSVEKIIPSGLIGAYGLMLVFAFFFGMLIYAVITKWRKPSNLHNRVVEKAK